MTDRSEYAQVVPTMLSPEAAEAFDVQSQQWAEDRQAAAQEGRRKYAALQAASASIHGRWPAPAYDGLPRRAIRRIPRLAVAIDDMQDMRDMSDMPEPQSD